jgi:predicted methyltransferase
VFKDSTRLRGQALLLGTLLLVLGLASSGLLGQNSNSRRDAWQRPQDVMDALGLAQGSAVADIGAGGGYFTFHLAERVGPEGRVYAVDIAEDELKKIDRRAERERLPQVETILGKNDDPRLPEQSLDAALVVNAYHEMREYDAMMAAIFRALKPGGQFGVIDVVIEPADSRSTYYRRHRIAAETVREDAARAGFRFRAQPQGFTRTRDDREFYFLVFEKPGSSQHPSN